MVRFRYKDMLETSQSNNFLLFLFKLDIETLDAPKVAHEKKEKPSRKEGQTCCH